MTDNQPTTMFELMRVNRNECPRCRGGLNVEWACESCYYDARPVADEVMAIREAAIRRASQDDTKE